MNKKWIVTIEPDPINVDDVILPIPDELAESLGWAVDDLLSATVEDGIITIRKVE